MNTLVNNKKIVVVLPAYNAAKTVQNTYSEIPKDIVDEVLLVDDKSKDETVRIANELGIKTILHNENKGYGGNQITCYNNALNAGADIIIMLHPDYQYTPKLIPAMISLIIDGEFDVILGSRILGGKALKGGMPLYKYFFNRVLTLVQNLFTGAKLSEYHTGYRAFKKEVLNEIPYQRNSNGFVFDNEIITQILYQGFKVGEISCPTKYDKDSSSINFISSIKYGFGCLRVSLLYLMSKWKLINPVLFNFEK